VLIHERFGQTFERENKQAYEIRTTFSEQILGYSYFAINKLTEPIEITMEAQNQNM
jgi:hypothetical protein